MYVACESMLLMSAAFEQLSSESWTLFLSCPKHTAACCSSVVGCHGQVYMHTQRKGTEAVPLQFCPVLLLPV